MLQSLQHQTQKRHPKLLKNTSDDSSLKY